MGSGLGLGFLYRKRHRCTHENWKVTKELDIGSVGHTHGSSGLDKPNAGHEVVIHGAH